MENDLSELRETLKHALLALVQQINNGETDDLHPPEIVELTDALVPLSPIPDPMNQLPKVVGSWTSLYARFGSGRSEGKSHLDDSNLALRSFRTFPEVPIHITGTFQEIGMTPSAYNNIDFFETAVTDASRDAVPGMIIIHGYYGPDDADSKRFRVIFHAAEVRPRDGATETDLRSALGLDAEAQLKRDFKPAKLYSDVAYLDEDIRINFGGMGGLYVLERRTGPAISL